MKTYTTYSTKETPQSEPVPGKDMVENSAGGYAFQVDDWKRLDRFLILGNEGGTYYASARKLTKENADCVLRCIKEDGKRTVGLITGISTDGRAPKNDPALFALAMCAGLGDQETRRAAFESLPAVARIGTHLFHFATYVEQFRGWGRGLSTAIKNWYQDKPIDKLAYQAIKYQSRDGWSHRDLLRLSHPKAEGERNALYRWIVKGEVIENLHELALAFEDAKKATSPKDIIPLIEKHNLPRECIPTELLNEPSVWEALLVKMPMTAMIRNLATMTRIGLIAPMSQANGSVIEALRDEAILKKARIHPIAVLSALVTYSSGHGARGQHSWEPVSQIVDALNGAFYKTFQNVETTGKRWLLALDVSSSMTWGEIAGVPGLNPRVASGAMALVTANSETQYHTFGFAHNFVPLAISPRQRLDDVIRTISGLHFGGTDCALPMIYALQNKIPVDVFTIYTDNETWFGSIHPFQALQQYRQKMGIPAKMIVVGMTATEFSIADPDDGGMLDVVGFDTAAPQIMSEFVK